MVLAKQRAQKEQDARVLLKRLGLSFALPLTPGPRIQAVNMAREHLAMLVPNAKEDLQELAFPDADGLDLQRRGPSNQAERSAERHFLPNLFKKVQEEVSSIRQAQLQVGI